MRARTRDSPVPSDVVIFEPGFTGHRMLFVSYLVGTLSDKNIPVVLRTTPRALSSAEFDMHMTGCTGLILDDRARAVRSDRRGNALDVLQELRRTARDHPDSAIVLMEGDKAMGVVNALPRTVRRRLTLLVLRSASRRDGIRGWAKRAASALADVSGVRIIALAPSSPPMSRYVVDGREAAPDPVELAQFVAGSARAEWMDTRRTWVAVVGHISRRKNLDLVARALARLEGEQFGLLVAGLVQPDEYARCRTDLASFEGVGGRVVTVDRLLTDAELDCVLNDVDLVVVAHSSEGPSGILARCAALGTPVVAAGAQSLREDVQRLGLGAWVPLDEEALADSIGSLAGAPRPTPVAMAGARDFADKLIPHGVSPAGSQ